ncbi:uridine diphosphate glucose pyrophosphatase NUDT22 isoform X2 [Brachyhypopomus gauderio]|uniref:uridine diphosphate glucose pyrophosphatase NUDT22 isoform X2 n=1 Tax=Brachyhypopomus gauderio TaxID=698409 RepID=UPI00404350AF
MFNRRSVDEIEKHIESVWNERVSREPWLFNGAKFRLYAAELSATLAGTSTCCNAAFTQQGNHTAPDLTPSQGLVGEGASPAEIHTAGVSAGCEKNYSAREATGACRKDVSKVSPKTTPEKQKVVLRLQLGLTCYKDFLGTNWSREAANLQRRGEVEFGDPKALLAQPLGVGAVLVTSDGYVVLLRRSQRVAEAPGLLDIPGGHPEPKTVCKEVREEAISIDLLKGCERAVVAEIFSSVCAEVRDEVNVPLSFLSSPVLMGIALNHTSAGRPSAEFYVRCYLTMEEVKDFYSHGGPEAHESTDVVFLKRAELLQLDECASLWSELCPSAKGAVLLYKLVRPD